MSCPVDHAALKEAKTPAPPKKAGKCPVNHSATPDPTNAKLQEGERGAVDAAVGGDASQLTAHFKAAYDVLGDRVRDRPQQMTEAREEHLLGLGYSKADLAFLGPDAASIQGTGNPLGSVELDSTQTVVDLGCGLGPDVFLASRSAGRVIGIDSASHELVHALERSYARGVTNVDFRVGDMEKVPVASGSVDVALSNGGFCLVADKAQALAEIFRMLKPGGSFSLCCTVRMSPLAEGVRWPSCFHAFFAHEDVQPTVVGAGFEEPSIVFADKVKSTATKIAKTSRTTIHRGEDTYAHLSDVDTGTMFRYVTVSSRKPL